MDARTEEVNNLVNDYIQLKIKKQENGPRQVIQNILKSTDPDFKSKTYYYVYLPCKICKDKTKGEKKAIKEIAFSDFKSSVKIILSIFADIEKQGPLENRNEYFVKAKTKFIHVNNKDDATILDLIAEDKLVNWDILLKTLQNQIKDNAQPVSEQCFLYKELLVWLEGMYLQYCIAHRRKEMMVMYSNATEFVPHPITGQEQISLGHKNAIIKITNDIVENEALVIILSILESILVKVFENKNISSNSIVTLLIELNNWYEIKHMPYHEIAFFPEIKNAIPLILKNMQEAVSNIQLQENIVPLVQELSLWLIGLYYVAYKDKEASPFVNNFMEKWAGVNLTEGANIYLEMFKSLNTNLQTYVAANPISTSKEIQEIAPEKIQVQDVMPIQQQVPLQPAEEFQEEKAMQIEVQVQQAEDKQVPKEQTQQEVSTLPVLQIQPELQTVQIQETPSAPLPISQSKLPTGKQFFEQIPKNWEIISAAAIGPEKEKIDSLLTIFNNEEYALTEKQKKRLSFMKPRLQNIANTYKKDTYLKDWLPSSWMEIFKVNLSAVNTIEQTIAKDEDPQVILKMSVEVLLEIQAKKSQHLYPALKELVLGAWAHLYNMYSPEQLRRLAQAAQYGLFQHPGPVEQSSDCQQRINLTSAVM